ncbi:MAG: hypothetical protein C0404_04045 [Verrucomicrobia bacterium]|nr:hypothetical protein [Verrucomicrobiota bacterium]
MQGFENSDEYTVGGSTQMRTVSVVLAFLVCTSTRADFTMHDITALPCTNGAISPTGTVWLMHDMSCDEDWWMNDNFVPRPGTNGYYLFDEAQLLTKTSGTWDRFRGEYFAAYGFTNCVNELNGSVLSVSIHTNHIIWMAAPSGTNAAVRIDDMDLSPPWDAPYAPATNNYPVYEGDFCYLAVTGNPGLATYIPMNGKFDYNVNCTNGLPCVYPAYGNGGDGGLNTNRICAVFYAYLKTPQNLTPVPQQPDYCKSPADYDGSQIYSAVYVPVYQAGELWGHYLTNAGLQNTYVDAVNSDNELTRGKFTFDIYPIGDNHVTDVIVDRMSLGSTNSYTFVNITNGGHTICATFETNEYEITASCGPGGTISPNGSLLVRRLLPDDEDYWLSDNVSPREGTNGLSIIDDARLLTKTETGWSQRRGEYFAAYDFLNCAREVNERVLAVYLGSGGPSHTNHLVYIASPRGTNVFVRIADMDLSPPLNPDQPATNNYPVYEGDLCHTAVTGTPGTAVHIPRNGKFDYSAHFQTALPIVYPAYGNGGKDGLETNRIFVNFYSYLRTPQTRTPIPQRPSYCYRDLDYDGTEVLFNVYVPVYQAGELWGRAFHSYAFANAYIDATGFDNKWTKGKATFTITPFSNCSISEIFIDGAPTGLFSGETNAVTYTFSNITNAHTILVAFNTNGHAIYPDPGTNMYQIVASCNSGGAISPTGTVVVMHGRSCDEDRWEADNAAPRLGTNGFSIVDLAQLLTKTAVGWDRCRGEYFAAYDFDNCVRESDGRVTSVRLGTGDPAHTNHIVYIASARGTNAAVRIADMDLSLPLDPDQPATNNYPVYEGDFLHTAVPGTPGTAVHIPRNGRLDYNVSQPSGLPIVYPAYGNGGSNGLDTNRIYVVFYSHLRAPQALSPVPQKPDYCIRPQDYDGSQIYAQVIVPVYQAGEIWGIPHSSNSIANTYVDAVGNDDVWTRGEIVFTINAIGNNHINDVIVDGISVGRTNLFTFSNVTNAHTIYVVFQTGFDYLSIDGLSATGISQNTLLCEWQSITGRIYQFYGSTNLLSTSAWITASGPITGNGTILNFPIPTTNETRAYYRIKATLQ